MINVILKFVVLSIFLLIFFQDVKDRLVFWFLYPSAGIVSYFIQSINIGYTLAFVNSVINLIFVTIILFILFLYSKFKLKIDFVNGSIGLGDILLFTCLSFTFSTVPFLILFVFSLLFSLLLHSLFKAKSEHKNVPLAGYISLFFAGIYFISFFMEPKYLFT